MRRASTGRDPFGGWFGRLVLPAVILQSVLIGGGYATGREIVEYGGKYGARGWLAVLAIFAGFTVVSVLTFEVARVFHAYDYKRFIRQLIGRAWPLFDLLFGGMAILVIAVMASAAANILHETLGVPAAAGTALIVLAVGGLLYLGAGVIEAFKSVGTAVLYLAYLLFAVLVLSRHWGDVQSTLAAGEAAYLPGAGVGAILGSGVLYVGYNLAVFPAVLFTLHRQTTRRQTAVAGLIAGLLMTVPFALTYLCLLAFYPAPEVLEAPVPWLRMLADAGGGWVLGVFGIVMGWTLLETSVGLIHALVDRIDAGLEEAADGEREGAEREGEAADERRQAAGLSRAQSGLLGAGILLAAALLSRFGIIELVATGYTLMSYLFIALFALPLLTVGLVRVGRWSGGGRGGAAGAGGGSATGARGHASSRHPLRHE